MVPGRIAPGRAGQFDGLRAWAVLGVFATHYLMNHQDWWVVRLDTGYLGVRLFFVLSGFLITGILLRLKSRIAARQLTVGRALKVFYLRRWLRLSPIYYLTILFGAFYLAPVREHLWAFLLYVQNHLFIAHPETYRSTVAHLWTLAVEEQFYLVWPLFLFLCPRRWLAGAVASVAVLGFVVGSSLSIATMDSSAIALLTVTNLATLGAGALVAVLGSLEYGDERLARRLSRVGMMVGPPLLLLGIAVPELHLDRRLMAPLRESGSALTFAWAVGRLCAGVPAGFRWALLSRPLRYVGTISYGIYLFHLPLIDLLGHDVYPWLGTTPPDGWRRLVIYGSCAIGLASLSWWLIESRINRLKDRLLVP